MYKNGNVSISSSFMGRYRAKILAVIVDDRRRVSYLVKYSSGYFKGGLDIREEYDIYDTDSGYRRDTSIKYIGKTWKDNTTELPIYTRLTLYNGRITYFDANNENVNLQSKYKAEFVL